MAPMASSGLSSLQGNSGSANCDILGVGLRRSGGLITSCHREFSMTPYTLWPQTTPCLLSQTRQLLFRVSKACASSGSLGTLGCGWAL